MLTTLTWEAVQEGIDDGRYVTTLRLLIDKARRSDQATQRELGDQAAEALRVVLDQVPADGNLASEGTLDELRGKLADQIVQLLDSGVSLDR